MLKLLHLLQEGKANFMSKLLPDFLEYAKGKFSGLKVNTNASMLNEKMVHSLLSSDLQTIVFSVDS